MANKQGKMQNYINHRMRATLNDGRQLAGQMLAFDKHMNLVLADTEEFRRVKRKAPKPAPGQDTSAQTTEVEEKRTLGLTIVRGTNIISCSVDGPPPQDPAARLGGGAQGGAAPAAMAAGPGISRSAGRGLPVGLTGPVAGMSGPGGLPGFPGAPPPGMAGRGGPPPGFMPPAGFPGGAPGGGPPPFQPPPGFQQPPPGQGRGFPPGFGGR